MLRKKLFNRVVSDAGYGVKSRTFKGFVEYSEGDHIAIVHVHPVMGQSRLNVFEDTLVVWQQPPASELVTEEKRKQIIQNIVEALRFLKVPVVLVAR